VGDSRVEGPADEPEQRYLQGILCVALFLLMALRPWFGPRLSSILFLSVVALHVWEARGKRKVTRRIMSVVLIALVITVNLVNFQVGLDAFVFLGLTLVGLFGCIYISIRALVQSRRITENEVFAIVNTYLIIGMVWAYIYELIWILSPAAFEFAHRPGDEMVCFVYFSFVTLTTVGYGDILPVDPFAQRMAIIEAVIGQLFLAIVVAYMLSRYMRHRSGGHDV